MKKFAQKNCRKMFHETIFSHSRKHFSEFPYKLFVTALHDIIGLQIFLSFCQSSSRITMRNLHWFYTFFTGVTLFALVLHLNCTALSQSESSNFFMCIIIAETAIMLFAKTKMVKAKKSKKRTEQNTLSGFITSICY